MDATIKVSWMRKAIWSKKGFRIHWFDFEFKTVILSWADVNPRSVKTYALKDFTLLRVTPRQFDRLWKGLPDFNSVLGHPAIPQLSIFTDGVRFGVVDTQGFNYPRYKSFLSDSDLAVVRSVFLSK